MGGGHDSRLANREPGLLCLSLGTKGWLNIISLLVFIKNNI